MSKPRLTWDKVEDLKNKIEGLKGYGMKYRGRLLNELNPAYVINRMPTVYPGFREEVIYKQDHSGPQSAVEMLLRRVTVYSGWADQFLQALVDIGQAELANFLSPGFSLQPHLIDPSMPVVTEDPPSYFVDQQRQKNKYKPSSISDDQSDPLSLGNQSPTALNLQYEKQTSTTTFNSPPLTPGSSTLEVTDSPPPYVVDQQLQENKLSPPPGFVSRPVSQAPKNFKPKTDTPTTSNPKFKIPTSTTTSSTNTYTSGLSDRQTSTEPAKVDEPVVQEEFISLQLMEFSVADPLDNCIRQPHHVTSNMNELPQEANNINNSDPAKHKMVEKSHSLLQADNTVSNFQTVSIESFSTQAEIEIASITNSDLKFSEKSSSAISNLNEEYHDRKLNKSEPKWNESSSSENNDLKTLTNKPDDGLTDDGSSEINDVSIEGSPNSNSLTNQNRRPTRRGPLSINTWSWQKSVRYTRNKSYDLKKKYLKPSQKPKTKNLSNPPQD